MALFIWNNVSFILMWPDGSFSVVDPPVSTSNHLRTHSYGLSSQKDAWLSEVERDEL